jgi:hypothetical protein
VTTAQLLDLAYLTHAGEWTYRFGPLGAPVLVLNDADADGSLWACEEPEGWNGTSAETPIEDRAYGDGGYAGETTFAPLVLTWTGTTVCPDRATMRAAIRRLRAVAQTRVPILYTQTDDPVDLSVWVRATGQPKIAPFDGLGFDWTFTMLAPDPFRFDATQLARELSTPLPAPSVGRIYPRVYPYVYGGTSAEGTIRVDNAGDEWAQATYRLTGPVPSPALVNQRTGEAAAWTLTLGPNDELVVDTATELVTLNGNPHYGDRVAGFVFPRIAPGRNDLRWSGSGVPDPAARLYLSTASTWR